jgi:hypothetical protein
VNQPLIGPGGKWNDTVLPTEYSLDYDMSRVSYLTYAEALGGIDGKFDGFFHLGMYALSL